MLVMIAGRAFFLDVSDLAVGAELTVVARDAPAREILEAEKANQTHHRINLYRVNALSTKRAFDLERRASCSTTRGWQPNNLSRTTLFSAPRRTRDSAVRCLCAALSNSCARNV